MSKSEIVLSFIDRDKATWRVNEEEFEGHPVLALSVTEEGSRTKKVVFHKDDAPFISWLIKQAAE